MRDFGVVTGNEADWVWEFDGNPEDHARLMAAIEDMNELFDEDGE